jgi:molybdenum cofactor cytidylyltransferase
MGGPKALASMGGQSFLVRGVRALWSACDTVVVVTGAESARVMREAGDEFEALVDKGLLAPDLKGGPKGRKGELEVRFVENRAWKRGMLSSAQAGLAAALRFRPEGVLVLPVDHPRVTARTVQALANMLEQALGSFGGRRDGGFAYALAPRHRGRRGHPVAMSSALAATIARDHAARDLSDAIRRSARLVGYLDVADAGILADLDTPRAGVKPPAAKARPKRAAAKGKAKSKPAAGKRASAKRSTARR